MRIALASCLAAALVACGGNVVVDTGTTATGGGGAGGSATTSGTTVSTECSSAACTNGTDGSCSCEALCGEQTLVTVCVGASCTCFENGIKIANCAGTGSSPCDPTGGCCAAAYFGQGQ